MFAKILPVDKKAKMENIALATLDGTESRE